MSREEIRTAFDNDIMFKIEKLVEADREGWGSRVEDMKSQIQGMLWVANSIGVLSHEEWRTANSMIIWYGSSKPIGERG